MFEFTACPPAGISRTQTNCFHLSRWYVCLNTTAFSSVGPTEAGSTDFYLEPIRQLFTPAHLPAHGQTGRDYQTATWIPSHDRVPALYIELSENCSYQSLRPSGRRGLKRGEGLSSFFSTLTRRAARRTFAIPQETRAKIRSVCVVRYF